MAAPSIDLDRLLRLLLVVGRFGEMDLLARWWNTKGQLGKTEVFGSGDLVARLRGFQLVDDADVES